MLPALLRRRRDFAFQVLLCHVQMLAVQLTDQVFKEFVRVFAIDDLA